MCELDMYGTIDVTVCVLDSINHLDSKEDILRCFSSVSLFCDPEGLFVFDINTVRKKTRTALMSVPVRIFQRLLYRLKKLKNYCIRQASEFLTDIII